LPFSDLRNISQFVFIGRDFFLKNIPVLKSQKKEYISASFYASGDIY